MNKTIFRTFRRIAVATALTTAMTGASVSAQDSVRDRLSPGNGADWAGEIHAGPNEYDQSVDRNRYDNEYYGYGNTSGNQQRSVSPSYYRDGRTGRYFYLDDNNRAVFDQSNGQITGQSSAMPGRTVPQSGQFQSNQFSGSPGQWQSSQGQPQYNQSQPLSNQGQPQSNWNQGNQGQNNQGPLLGVALEDTDQGIRVVDVARNSAAQQAGIQPGDVIVEFNGTAYSDLSAGTFTSKVGQMNPGDQLTLVVKRNGQDRQLKATLGGQPSNKRYQSAKSPVQGESPQAIKQRLEELRTKVDRLEQKLDEMTQSNPTNTSDASAQAGENKSNQPSEESSTTNQSKADPNDSSSSAKSSSAKSSSAKSSSAKNEADNGEGAPDQQPPTPNGQPPAPNGGSDQSGSNESDSNQNDSNS